MLGLLVFLDGVGAILGASGIQRGSQIGTRGSTMVFRRGVEKRFEKIEETNSHNECFGGGYNLENRAPV